MKVFDELIDVCLAKGKPFAAFRLPGESLPQIIVELDANSGSKEEKTSDREFVFAPFVRSVASPPLRIRADWDLRADGIQGDHLWELEQHPDRAILLGDTLPYSMSRSEHLALVQDTIEEIDNRDPDKIVISRVQLVDRDSTVLLSQLFHALCGAYKTAYVSLVHHPDAGIWIGASPETLLNGWQTYYQTMALAGTRKLLPGMTEVSWRPKEQEEQAMVADFISEVLEDLGANIMSMTGPMSSLAGQMAHLKTMFEFEFEGNIQTLIERLHPTPAVSGLPQQEAIDFIVNREPHDRAYYAGYMGVIHPKGNTRLWVNLRNMQVFDEQYALYIGGGITTDSKPMEEWQETQLKAGTLLSVLQNLSMFAPKSAG
ncbi:MAG: chorismate-binding protein [Bacteroidota bacterium]